MNLTDKRLERIACPVDTPLGIFTAIYENRLIKRVLFPSETPGADISYIDGSLDFSTQMKEYFDGKRKKFSLQLFLPGSYFRQNVYKTTIDIPYGSTASYSGVALAAGYPLAMRAVGSAMKANPLPILIPCHRVVHKSGKKAAYGGGLDIKHYLLDLENKYQ